jgi:hypothetical protein
LGNPIVWPEGVVPPPARENPGYLETARPLWLESALAANRNAAFVFCLPPFFLLSLALLCIPPSPSPAPSFLPFPSSYSLY